MILVRSSGRIRASTSIFCRNYITAQAHKTQPVYEEYSEKPEYPEIKDLSFKGRKKNETLTWQQEIQKVKTVEEKMIKINMPRYYGYKVVQMSEVSLPYNCLPAIQHYTRTLYDDIACETEQETAKLVSNIEEIKKDVQEVVEMSHAVAKYQYPSVTDPTARGHMLTQNIVEQINRTLTLHLLPEFKHLGEVETDYNPRHEAFWCVGGIQPPKNIVKSKEGRKWQKEMAYDNVDRWMQYSARPYLAHRHRLQLSPWKTESEYCDPEQAKKVPRFQYDPRSLGYTTGYQHGTNIHGQWPCSVMANFGSLSFQSRAVFQIRPASYGPEDFQEALHAHAIQSSFAWLLAQANYMGFNTFSELTYPLNTQTIITDGQKWSFYEYQLNTLLMSGEHIDENPRVNFCRGTKELKLYDEIDSEGKLIGFNDQVLNHLIKFYTNKPNIKRAEDELTPFLDPTYKRIADYPEADKREWLDKTFKHLCSNRPRHLSLPEIYMWEKIYKIDNKTRPMEPRRRFFELFVNPWKRTLDQHQKEYIPKALRPEGPKSKKKWKQTYYP